MSKVYLVASMLAVALFAVATNDTIAARCSGIADPVFCDDFDRHCVNPPVDPDAACPLGSAEDIGSFLSVWPVVGNCGTAIDLSTQDMWKPDGFGAYYFFNVPTLVRHEAMIVPAGAVNGTGEILSSTDPGYVDPATNPDVLKGQFFVHTPSTGAFANFVFYVELSLDDDRAPTGYVTFDCTKYNGEAPKYPIVCQAQHFGAIPAYPPPYDAESVTCPPLDSTVHASFAFGLMSIVDPNPCLVDTGRRPSVYRAVVFDGVSWTEVRQPRFDLPTKDSELKLSNDYNFFYYFIGENSIEIRLKNEKSEAAFTAGSIPNDYFVANVPRQYTGPFNKISLGPGHGSDITDPENPGPETCLEGGWVANNMVVEEVVMWDGFTVDVDGACCLPNGTCIQTSEDDCLLQGGEYNGDFSVCEEVNCCGVPFADRDHDGDVDQADFARFQRCLQVTPLSEECACLDRYPGGTADGVINEDDFVEFVNCATGPDVLMDINSPPPGCTP